MVSPRVQFRYLAAYMSTIDPHDGVPLGRRHVIMGVGSLLAALTVGVLSVASATAADPPSTILAQGRILGGKHLLNPVWTEAADPKTHRYTFRQPSPTVGRHAKKLRAYLPKELCIVALTSGKASPSGTPVKVHVSGGRTSPVTLVVAEKQSVQFINDDPFPHKLFDTKGVAGGLGPEETKKRGERAWTPPGPGVYEIRDKYFPSIRSWIVVEPRAAAVTYPTRKNTFALSALKPGQYTLQAYFSGKPTGKSSPLEVRPRPSTQQIQKPLVVALAKSGKSDKKKK